MCRVACRGDCASKYALDIQLLSKNHDVLDRHRIEKEFKQWDCSMWQKVGYVIWYRHIYSHKIRLSNRNNCTDYHNCTALKLIGI